MAVEEQGRFNFGVGGRERERENHIMEVEENTVIIQSSQGPKGFDRMEEVQEAQAPLYSLRVLILYFLVSTIFMKHYIHHDK